jgi:hypothetical protein
MVLEDQGIFGVPGVEAQDPGQDKGVVPDGRDVLDLAFQGRDCACDQWGTVCSLDPEAVIEAVRVLLPSLRQNCACVDARALMPSTVALLSCGQLEDSWPMKKPTRHGSREIKTNDPTIMAARSPVSSDCPATTATLVGTMDMVSRTWVGSRVPGRSVTIVMAASFGYRCCWM